MATAAELLLDDPTPPEDFLLWLSSKGVEGFHEIAEADTEGYLTIGHGHKVLPGEKWKEGDRITKEEAWELLKKDAKPAWKAAREQARQIGRPDMLKGLLSINYQLGTSWNKEHTKTWGLLTEGQWDKAAIEAENSRWAKQTPVRIRHFQKAIRGELL